jgi:hypothetical protein
MPWCSSFRALQPWLAGSIRHDRGIATRERVALWHVGYEFDMGKKQAVLFEQRTKKFLRLASAL